MSKYKIVRFYQDDNKPSEIIKTGLTLEQAQKHCQDPSTSGDGWFDGFEDQNEPKDETLKKLTDIVNWVEGKYDGDELREHMIVKTIKEDILNKEVQ